MQPLLSLEQVGKSYGRAASPVLQDINLRLVPGEFIAVMGESGAGKSTLLNLIAGLETPDAGHIVFDGQRVEQLDDASRTRLRRSQLGFVFQAFHLLPYLTVERNVALPLALNSIAGSAAAQRAQELLLAVGLDDRKHSFPAELSGGEMQRVAIARALAHRPRLILADEPTGNLDADSASQVLTLLRDQLKKDGAAGILVTHSEVAARTADRIYRLSQQGLR